MPTEHESAILMIHDYYMAFSTLQVEAIFPYYHEPSLILSPEGVFCAPKRTALSNAFQPAMEGLRDLGFLKTEFVLRQVRSLGSATIWVTGLAVRTHQNGQELNRAGVTYTLRKTDDEWKIAVLVTHDADAFGE